MALFAGPAALALLAAFCFGLALVLTQFGLRHLPPARAALVSVPSSTLLFWLLSPFFLAWRGFSPGAAAIFAAIGVLFPASVTLLTFEANRRMGPTYAGALGNLAPLFALMGAMLLLGERPGAVEAAGIAAILAGIFALSLERRWEAARWPLRAMLVPLGAAAIRGLVQPLAKLGLALWPSPFAAALIGYSVSSLVLLLAARVKGAPGGTQAAPAGHLWFVAVGLCNGAAVLLLYTALARGSVMLVSALVATYPLLTLALSALLLRRARLGPAVLAGVALTVGGVVVLIGSR